MFDDIQGALGAATKVTSLATSINQGVAAVTTGIKNFSSAVSMLSGNQNIGFAGFGGDSQSGDLSSNINHYMNPLEKFASYTPLWTFAVLRPEQFNNPSTYRGKPSALKDIVFSSAGRYDSQRVRTESGAPEFYVNNFTMISHLTASPKTGNSNAISFSWEIFEPYSMGLLLESMQVAAINAGYTNYMDNCPYLLRLDFQGYDETGSPMKGSEKLSKYYVCKLKKVTFDVNEQGSVYKVEAIPYSHLGYSSLINQVFTDINLEGGSVKEVLISGEKSLTNVLNNKQKQLVVDRKQDLPDTYFVWFPTSAVDNPPAPPPRVPDTATVDPNGEDFTLPGFDFAPPELFGANAIGQSDLDFDIKSGGTYPTSSEGDVYDESSGVIDRGSIKISPKARTLMFSQGQTVTQMITSVIMSSRYVYSVFDEAKKNPTGEVWWFKVDVQVQLKGYDSCRGDYAKHIIFRVIPYKVHSSIFSAPGAVPPGYNQLTKKIVKNYNYIYTGKNQDIIKFDLQFNNMFFTGVQAGKEANSRNIVNKGTQNTSTDAEPSTEINCDNKKAGLISRTGAAPAGKTLDPGLPSATGEDTVQKRVAAQFQQAFLNGSSGDMIKANLEIIGDPYYLVDGSMNNYFSPEYQDGINADGTMTYDGSDVYIYITFRTPNDVLPEKGLYDFKGTAVSPFSGIFKIIKVESTFKDGVFRQTLQLTRMQKQPSDFEGSGTNYQPDSKPFAIVPGNQPDKPVETNTESEVYIPPDP